MLIQLDDLALWVEQRGNGPPLLLLHGFTGSAAAWGEQLATLAQLRHVVAPNLIGHGQSSAPADPSRYTMERCVADLLSILDQLEVRQFDLLGYSMGGRVAMHLALTAPQRVRSLILESAAPGIADPAERAARVASDNLLATQIEIQGLSWFSSYWAGLALFASQRRLPPQVLAAQRERRLSQRPEGLANSLRGMGAGRQASLWGRLGELSMPTLLIAGALDPKYVAISQAMAAQITQAQLGIVQDAGHTVHLEQPTAFAELVVGFLASGEIDQH